MFAAPLAEEVRAGSIQFVEERRRGVDDCREVGYAYSAQFGECVFETFLGFS